MKAFGFYIIILWITVLGTHTQAQFVSKFGDEILSQSDIVVRGIPIGTTPLKKSGQLVQLRITHVYRGKIDLFYPINLIYNSLTKQIDKKEWVVIAKKLSSQSTYKVVKEFTSKQKDFKLKTKALKKLIAIENLSDLRQKKQLYWQYCVEHLKSSEKWERWHAFWEWQYFVNTHMQKNINNKKYPKKMMTQIVSAYQQVPELSLKKQLRNTIVEIKRNFKEEVVVDKAAIKHKGVQQQAQKYSKLLHQAKDNKQKAHFLNYLTLYPCNISRNAFVWALDDNSQHIRALSLFYLRLHGTPSEIPKIANILRQDPSLRVRKNAILALAALGAKDLVDEIALYQRIPFTRRAAQQAIDILVPKNILPSK